MSALVVGLAAANLALFNWVEQTGIQYLLGQYARYVCAYGGFASIILGSMLVNESVSAGTRIAEISAMKRMRSLRGMAFILVSFGVVGITAQVYGFMDQFLAFIATKAAVPLMEIILFMFFFYLLLFPISDRLLN